MIWYQVREKERDNVLIQLYYHNITISYYILSHRSTTLHYIISHTTLLSNNQVEEIERERERERERQWIEYVYYYNIHTIGGTIMLFYCHSLQRVSAPPYQSHRALSVY
jgi:hypothetical protein